jgi:hypothetical protein
MVHISTADLIRDPDGVLDAVTGGEAALVERNGQVEAAILGIVDYRLLRAAATG